MKRNNIIQRTHRYIVNVKINNRKKSKSFKAVGWAILYRNYIRSRNMFHNTIRMSYLYPNPTSNIPISIL